jgi:single-strand DNA-binding protein
VWGKSAELVRDMNEGEKLYVQGSIGTESWEQDGEKKYKTVIKANRVNLVTEDGIANDPF